jgi:hypothetical protein
VDITYHHQLSGQDPSPYQLHSLPGPIQPRWWPTASALVIPFRGGEHGQNGQRPYPVDPGNACQPHQAHPAQPAGFDKVGMRRAYWIAVDPFRRESLPAASLNGLIEAHHHRPFWHEGVQQQAQQHAAGLVRRPLSTIEYTMIVLKMGVSALPVSAALISSTFFTVWHVFLPL